MQTSLQNRQFLPVAQPAKRRSGLPVGRIAERPARPFAHDFLTQSFPEIIIGGAGLETIAEHEKHFFDSLAYLKQSYDLPEIPVPDAPFPLNIKFVFDQLKPFVDQQSYFERLFLVENGKHPFCLATGSAYGTGNMLYYVPMDVLYRLSKKRKIQKEECDLIFSVYHYLLSVAEIANYAEGGYMSGTYHTLKEWLEGDDEDFGADTAIHWKEIQTAFDSGKRLSEKIKSPKHLCAWQKRLDRYIPDTEKGRELQSNFQAWHDLYRQYPDRRISDQLFHSDSYSENDEVMPIGEYLSFVWSLDGWLAEESLVYVTDEIGNYSHTEEPLQFKIYDQPEGRISDNLDFEKRFFLLLNDFIYLIHNNL